MVERVGKIGRARRWRGACAWLALAAALALLGPAPALSVEDSDHSDQARASDAGRQAFDLVILRPLQVVQVAVGAVVFVPAYPVSLLFDGGEDVLEICITEPVERAFRRPLGDL